MRIIQTLQHKEDFISVIFEDMKIFEVCLKEYHLTGLEKHEVIEDELVFKIGNGTIAIGNEIIRKTNYKGNMRTITGEPFYKEQGFEFYNNFGRIVVKNKQREVTLKQNDNQYIIIYGNMSELEKRQTLKILQQMAAYTF